MSPDAEIYYQEAWRHVSLCYALSAQYRYAEAAVHNAAAGRWFAAWRREVRP